MLTMYTFEIKPPTLKTTNSHTQQQIDNYIYNTADQIGLGFVSNVYLGKQKHTNKPVAIKIINTAKQDALGMELLQQEISALQKIKRFNCKHLLLLQSHFTHSDKLYIVSEYCEGKDIAKLLREHKKFTQAQAQTIMKQILQAYAEVYELGLVHRDLKLSNLLIKNDRIKLADFGFSVQIVDCIDQFTYNAGSPYYMPPQSLKRNRFTFKSDIWALGVMAYELIYGQLPYKQKVQCLQYQKIMGSDIQDIFKNRQQPSQSYKKFIIECMQKDMQKRATPQYCINHHWPQANTTLDGLFKEDKQINQNNSKTTQPRLLTNLSTQQLRPVVSALNSPVVSPTNQHTHHLQFTQRDITKPIQQDIVRARQQNKTLYQHRHEVPSNVNMNKMNHQSIVQSTNRPSIRSVNEQNLRVQHRNNNNNTVQLNGSFEQLMKIEATVHSYINYCTFLHKIILLITSARNIPDSSMLTRYFSHKITTILCELANLMNGATNRLSNVVLGPQFMINQSYAKLKRQVQLNTLIFQNKLQPYNKGALPQKGVLLRCMRSLSQNIRNSYTLLFWLSEQHELQQMDSHHNSQYFVRHSNIDQLCKLDLGKHVEVSQNEIVRLKGRVQCILSRH